MAFCKSCGADIDESVKFCPGCGAPKEGPAPSVVVTDGKKSDSFNFMGEDHTAKFDVGDIESNKVVCGISYLWVLFFLPLVACQESKLGKFHANQALLLFLYGIASGIVGGTCSIIPIIGGLIPTLLSIAGFAAMVYCMVNTFMGKAKEVPLIGRITIIKYE